MFAPAIVKDESQAPSYVRPKSVMFVHISDVTTHDLVPAADVREPPEYLWRSSMGHEASARRLVDMASEKAHVLLVHKRLSYKLRVHLLKCDVISPNQKPQNGLHYDTSTFVDKGVEGADWIRFTSVTHIIKRYSLTLNFDENALLADQLFFCKSKSNIYFKTIPN